MAIKKNVLSGEPRFFRDSAEARAWFEKNHKKAEALWVGIYKKHTGSKHLGYKAFLDEALCFGWIDGVVNTIDADTYKICFTPRKPGSIWSQVNIKRMEELIEEGRVHPEGLAAFQKKDPKKQKLYSFENKPAAFTPELEKLFKTNRKAWKWFSESAPYYRKTATFWVMSAKREETRQKRLKTLISDSAKGKKIAPLSYGTKKSAM